MMAWYPGKIIRRFLGEEAVGTRKVWEDIREVFIKYFTGLENEAEVGILEVWLYTDVGIPYISPIEEIYGAQLVRMYSHPDRIIAVISEQGISFRRIDTAPFRVEYDESKKEVNIYFEDTNRVLLILAPWQPKEWVSD